MKLLKPYVKKKLLESFQKTEFLYPTLHIVKANIADDHVHMIAEVAPSVSIASMVQKLKAHASLELKRNFKFIREADDGSGIWSVGYFASSIGLNEKMSALERFVTSATAPLWAKSISRINLACNSGGSGRIDGSAELSLAGVGAVEEVLRWVFDPPAPLASTILNAFLLPL